MYLVYRVQYMKCIKVPNAAVCEHIVVEQFGCWIFIVGFHRCSAYNTLPGIFFNVADRGFGKIGHREVPRINRYLANN